MYGSVECFLHVSSDFLSNQMMSMDNAIDIKDVRSNLFHSRNKAFHFSSHGSSSI